MAAAVIASAAPGAAEEEQEVEDEVEVEQPAVRLMEPVASGLAGTREGFGGGSSEPEEPQDMACTRRFSLHIVSSRSLRSSVRMSLSKTANQKSFPFLNLFI